MKEGTVGVMTGENFCKALSSSECPDINMKHSNGFSIRLPDIQEEH